MPATSCRRGQPLAELKRAEVEASVAQAAESVEKARRDLERAKRLRADEVATEEQVQDLGTAYNVARANLDAVRFNASFARIEAPVDGIDFDRLAEAGELVQPGQSVLVLGATDSGWVVRIGPSDRDAIRVEHRQLRRPSSSMLFQDVFSSARSRAWAPLPIGPRVRSKSRSRSSPRARDLPAVSSRRLRSISRS